MRSILLEDPSHPLFGASLKIHRARDQVNALRAAIKEFLGGNPYVLETQVDPQAELVLQVLRVKQDCPPMWSAVIGEIVHSLRCALDYLVFQLVILETGAEPGENSRTQFPIFLARDGFHSERARRMLQGVGGDARALIEAVQPFATGQGAESPLWILSTLSNWDKHRSIHLTGARTQRSSASFVYGPSVGGLLFPDGPFKDNTPVSGVRIAPGPEPFLERAAKAKMDFELALHIALDKPIAIPNKGVPAVLDVLGTEVLRIAARINIEIFGR